MERKNKLKKEALKLLADKSRRRAKRTLASQDREKDIDEKQLIDEKISKIGEEDKTVEQLEKEAEKRYREERAKRGYLTRWAP